VHIIGVGHLAQWTHRGAKSPNMLAEGNRGDFGMVFTMSKSFQHHF